MIETWLKQDLQSMVQVTPLGGNLFSADDEGNRIGVIVTDGGEEATLSGTVTGYVIRNDAQTVLVTGTLSGNRAYIDLPKACYIVPGQISIVIQVDEVTMGACTGYVYQARTDEMIDPGDVVPDISELLAKIGDCETATTAANTAATAANTAATNVATIVAPVFAEGTANAAGTYVTKDGKLYLLPSGHTANTTWDNTTKTEVTAGDQLSDLKSALAQENEFIGNISQTTKNLFSPITLSAKRPGLKYENGVWYGNGDAWVPANAQTILDINDTDAIQYTLSFEAKVEGATTSGVGVVFKFTDSVGTKQVNIPNNTSDWTSFSVTSTANRKVQNLTTVFSSGGNNITYIRKLQLEVGTSATTFVYPLTAYDKKAEERLDEFDALGIARYPTTENWAYDSYVNFMDQNPFTIDNTRIGKSNGATGANTSYICTNFLYVPKGKKVYYKLYSSNSGLSCLYLYNLDETPNSSIVDGGTDAYQEGNYTATADCYIRSCYDKSRTECYLHFTQTGNVIDRLNDIQDVLPSYWETHLAGKENDINGFIASVGNHGDYFLLFTDYHLKSNIGYTPAIIQRLCKRYPIDKVINCGDILNTETTKASAESVLDNFFEQFKGINLLNVFGNHDSNPYGSGASLTEAEVYNFLFKRNEQIPNLSPTKGGYYYLDNPLQKIRYIVLNTHGNGFETDDKTTQLPWMIDAMKTVETGWYICIIMHMGFEWYNSEVGLFAAGATVKTIADAYQNRGSGTVMTDVSFNFSDAVGKVACVISGHAHINTYVTSDAGYSIIGFDRDALNYPPVIGDETRMEGNATEQSLALVSIDTTAKKVKCLGIGAGADREFTFA